MANPAHKKIKMNSEYFPDIKMIPFHPTAPVGDVLCYRHYNAEEMLMGRTMEEWLRFSVCCWHSFKGKGADPFGSATIKRSWDDGSESIENYKRRLMAAFEFFSKLGIRYYTFHDLDLAPEGDDLRETNSNIDLMADLAADLQRQTGVKLLWMTSNLFTNPRYMNGAVTSPDAHVAMYAAAQVKKGLDVAKRLGAQNFVFWGGREGYQSLLNTDLKSELDHMASFFRMVVAYTEKIKFTGQLLIEPKAKEPMRHQYDYDAQTVMSFLHHYDLAPHFKLNIEPNHTTLAGHPYEHDVLMASAFGFLGSIDANTGSPDCGWDTDQFPMDIRNTTIIMKTVIEQGGLSPGGLNFDAKVRRESTEPEDLFIAHIGAMDAFAKGLRNAVKIVQDGIMRKALQDRYNSWYENEPSRIAANESTLEACEKYVMKNGSPEPSSGQQEKFEAILNHYI